MVRRKWQELRQKIRKSEFGRHILTVFSGTLAAQIFSFLILPLLAYLFTPEDIGIRGVFLAVQASLAIALNGGYELAIMLPEKEEDAGNHEQGNDPCFHTGTLAGSRKSISGNTSSWRLRNKA